MPSLRVAYVDTETTGLSSKQDRIIEIAVVLAEVDWVTGAIVQRLDEYHGLQDPGRKIPWDAIAVHGITDAMVRGQKIEGRKVFRMLAAADMAVAHNSGFDKGFVAQVAPLSNDLLWGCSCRGIPWRKLYPGLASTSLQALSDYFGSPKGSAHRAMGDVETQMNLVSLPGIQGGLAFQHYLLHMKLRRPGFAPRAVLAPDQAFKRLVIQRRAFGLGPLPAAGLWPPQGASSPPVSPAPQGIQPPLVRIESFAHLLK